MSASLKLGLSFILMTLVNADLSSRIVKTNHGDLSGVIVSLGRNLERVEVFRGVPYASPPIGSLRFMPPVSGAIWHGVKVAEEFGPVCPQKLPTLTDEIPKGRVDYLRRLLPYFRNQNEDCLYLNVYAPVQGNIIYDVITSIWVILHYLRNSLWVNFAFQTLLKIYDGISAAQQKNLETDNCHRYYFTVQLFRKIVIMENVICHIFPLDSLFTVVFLCTCIRNFCMAGKTGRTMGGSAKNM